MSYKVQFLGLVCFFREPGGRLAMLPDGRKPGDGIDPHYANIAIRPEDIHEVSGWNGQFRETGMFRLPKCEISIDSAETNGTLDTSAQEPHLPRLGPGFRIDPATAQTVARMKIRRGKLAAFLVPGGTAVMSQLEVPYDGDIQITVTPERGEARYIRVAAGAEIAITNTAGDYRRGIDHDDHFRIYEKLSSEAVKLKVPRGVSEGLRESSSKHFLFTEGMSISLTEACSNTGCCRP